MPRVSWRSLSLAACVAGLAGLMALAPRDDSPPPPAQPSAAPGPRASEPLDLVPAESLLCWYGRPFPDTTPAGASSTIGSILQLIPRVAPLDAQAKLYARIVEAFALSIRYPHALVLIDAQAKPVESDPNARRVDRLRFAAIVQSGDQHEAFVRIIQTAVNEQTDSAQATLVRRQAGDWRYQELLDQRLPAWSTVAWGEIDEHFVLTVGPDVWPMVAAVATGTAPALSRADWLVNVRGQRGRDALIEIVVAAEAIRERLDPFVEGRATDFFNAWHAGNLQRAHWALGFEGRALYCVAHFMERGRVRERIYADPAIRERRLLATIPQTARYAVYHVSSARVLPRLWSGVLATQGRKYRRRIQELWDKIQAEYGFDVERDLLAHLGDYTVMHNYPPHPLHIPLAMTTLTEIRDEPDTVRRTIETMCHAWRAVQRRHAAETGSSFGLSLQQDAQGIWHVRYPFFAGPAWIVTDRFIITSWSPSALHSYLEKVGDRIGPRRAPSAR